MNRNLKTEKVLMASIVSILFLIPLLWFLPYQPELQTPNEEPTWLHVDGKYIKSESGLTVFLRGTAFGDLAWRTTWQGNITHRLNQMVELTDGKVNVIRVAISPNPQYQNPKEPPTWAPGDIHPEVFDDDVDLLVDLAAQNDIYLIIEFHGGLNMTETTRIGQDPTDWINWHLHFVNRYKDNPIVTGFELWNEPYAPYFADGDTALGEERFANIVTECVQAITQANPDALILASSAFPGYSYIGQYWIDNPLSGNVVYTWDWYYMWWPTDLKDYYHNKDWSMAYNKSYENIDRAIGDVLRANLPVLASEFGWYGPNAPLHPHGNCEPEWERNMHDYMSILNDLETNWYMWRWWGDPYNLGLANDFHYSELSPQGEIWAQYLWDGGQPAIPLP